MKHTVRRLTELSLYVAVAMILSFVEARLPAFLPVPGAKLGLGNVAVVLAFCRLGPADAGGVGFVRVVLSALLFGTPVSLLYSLFGAVASFFVMWGLFALRRFSPVGVSAAGGVAHNLGQLLAAGLVLRTEVVLVYLPGLLLLGILCGLAVGVAGGALCTAIERALPTAAGYGAGRERSNTESSNNQKKK